jgi:hypothetical protein
VQVCFIFSPEQSGIEIRLCFEYKKLHELSPSRRLICHHVYVPKLYMSTVRTG